jgi:hypothetical protein
VKPTCRGARRWQHHDAYSPRAAAWFTSDDCLVLVTERAQHLRSPGALCRDRALLLMVLFFLVPFGLC